MNDYRISYTIDNGYSVDTTTITERNEAAARKAFKVFSKAGAITSIELVRENTCATKQQERDTLAAIRRMVDELGPQSYLATAFDGCWEDAESNIENDFGDSMKARFESAECRYKEAEKEALAISKDFEEAQKALRDKDSNIDRLERKILYDEDLLGIISLISEKRLSIETEVKNAAERIVEAAAEPESAAFQNAVKDHRAAKSDLDRYMALLERLVKAQRE